jgi:hypothetical protein
VYFTNPSFVCQINLFNKAIFELDLSRNDVVALGSAVISTAVLGVSPKTSAFGVHAPNGDPWHGGRPSPK